MDLTWIGDLKFSATFSNRRHHSEDRYPIVPERLLTSDPGLILDSSGTEGPSPVDALGAAVASCMTTDVVDILLKGRHPMTALESHLVAERAAANPHRFVSMALHFTIEGQVPREAIERAIALSRDKYCSVWHSMRQDIAFTVTFDQRA